MAANPYMRDAMNALHVAILHETDPEAVSVLTQCQSQLAKLQKNQMAPPAGAGAGGGQGGSPASPPQAPQGGIGGGSPQELLLQRVLGG